MTIFCGVAGHVRVLWRCKVCLLSLEWRLLCLSLLFRHSKARSEVTFPVCLGEQKIVHGSLSSLVFLSPMANVSQHAAVPSASGKPYMLVTSTGHTSIASLLSTFARLR